MFLFREPTEADVSKFRQAQLGAKLTYAAVGATRTSPPLGFRVNRFRAQIGHGRELYERAGQAVLDARILHLAWARPVLQNCPLRVDDTVVLVVRHKFAWSLNACRVIYLIDEQGPASRRGFAYGTLPGHGVRGEELFQVEWDSGTDQVSYMIYSFSRPAQLIAWVGIPLLRSFQARFVRESAKVLQTALASGG